MFHLRGIIAGGRLLLAVILSSPAVSLASDLVDVIARIKPSVVMVGTYQAGGSPQFSLLGTGFVVGDGRTVATNAHVVEAAQAQIAARIQGGGTMKLVVASTGSSPSEPKAMAARLLSLDKTHDLAVLRLDAEVLPALVLGDSASVREGQSVAFIGFPIGNVLGFVPVTHRGIVSAVTPIVLPTANARQLGAASVRGLRDGAFSIFQLDGTAYPGNSGGPMFDASSGEVIGVINMVLVKERKESVLSQPSGISYAIPSNYLRDLITNAR